MTDNNVIKTDPAKEAERLKGILKKASDSMDAIDERRAKLNAEANEVREGLRKEGLNVEAFGAARNFNNTLEDKQRGFDLTYTLIRDALGQPIQRELNFSELADPAEDAPAQATATG